MDSIEQIKDILDQYDHGLLTMDEALDKIAIIAVEREA